MGGTGRAHSKLTRADATGSGECCCCCCCCRCCCFRYNAHSANLILRFHHARMRRHSSAGAQLLSPTSLQNPTWPWITSCGTQARGLPEPHIFEANAHSAHLMFRFHHARMYIFQLEMSISSEDGSPGLFHSHSCCSSYFGGALLMLLQLCSITQRI